MATGSTFWTILLWLAIGLIVVSILSTFLRRKRLAPEVAHGRRLMGVGQLFMFLALLKVPPTTASVIFMFMSLLLVLRGGWILRRARMNGREQPGFSNPGTTPDITRIHPALAPLTSGLRPLTSIYCKPR